MKSFGLWYLKSQVENIKQEITENNTQENTSENTNDSNETSLTELEHSEFDLHVNFWSLEDYKHTNNSIVSCLDIGIKIYKYEFRKKICLKNIDKIYLYATSPIKKIVGEADVLEKSFMNKKNLWKDTQKWAGITEDFYEQYFQKQACAGAYKLGKTTRYENPLEIKALGINFVPQSYVYIDTL